MTLKDLLDDGKSDVHPPRIRARVQAPPKYREDTIGIFHVNTDPVVLHRKHPAVVRFLHSYVNFRVSSPLNFSQR